MGATSPRPSSHGNVSGLVWPVGSFGRTTTFGIAKIGSGRRWHFLAEIPSELQTWNFRSRMGNMSTLAGVLCHSCKWLHFSTCAQVYWKLSNFQTSQLIEVVTWRSGDPTLIYSLRAHTRVITDIDWHSKIPHLLASCSIDTFTHLWDLRDPKKPILSLSAVCMCKCFKGIRPSPREDFHANFYWQLEQHRLASTECLATF